MSQKLRLGLGVATSQSGANLLSIRIRSKWTLHQRILSSMQLLVSGSSPAALRVLLEKWKSLVYSNSSRHHDQPTVVLSDR